jgi:hypothetical protein
LKRHHNTALLGLTNIPKPTIKTLLVGINLEFLLKDTKTKLNNAITMEEKNIDTLFGIDNVMER